MIEVGEETAELSSMLLNIAETNQREMDSDLEILTSLLEPVMIVVIGLIIGVVIVAMYLPIFELMNVIQKKHYFNGRRGFSLIQKTIH